MSHDLTALNYAECRLRYSRPFFSTSTSEALRQRPFLLFQHTLDLFNSMLLLFNSMLLLFPKKGFFFNGSDYHSPGSFLINTAILHLTEVQQNVGNFLRGFTKLTEHRQNMNQEVH